MVEHGYVKWWRSGMLNALWNEKPFDSWHAWDYLMARAAHAAHRVHFQKRTFNLQRGQLVTTYRQLARDWGWSNHRVKRFLNALVSPKTFTFSVPDAVPPDDPQVTVDAVGGCILVTLCNYAAYQDAKNAEDLKNLLKKGRASRKSSHPPSLKRPTGVPPASHRRPTREEGEEGQQQQEGKERTSGLRETSVAAAGAARAEGSGGEGTARGAAVAVPEGGVQETDAPASPRHPSLGQISVRRGAELLEAVGVDPRVAFAIAGDRPVGEILDICVEARGKKKPAGHARRAIERGWKAPACHGPEVESLLRLLEADALPFNSRFQKLVGGALLLDRKSERLPGESDEAYLKRVQAEARARTAGAKA
jgi:hypothetical protein